MWLIWAQITEYNNLLIPIMQMARILLSDILIYHTSIRPITTLIDTNKNHLYSFDTQTTLQQTSRSRTWPRRLELTNELTIFDVETLYFPVKKLWGTLLTGLHFPAYYLLFHSSSSSQLQNPNSHHP